MRVSHVALLSLAASTAAPVFAAPISHLKACSKDGGVGLSARDPRKDISEADKLPSRSDFTSERLATRQAVREFMDTVASMNTRRSDVQQEVRGPSDDAFEVEERDNNPVDSRAAPVSPDENFSALLGSREPDSEQDIQARHFDLFGKAAKLLMDFIRRDVAPEILLARTDFDDPRNLDHRRSSISKQQMNARANFDEFSQTPSLSSSSRRDVGSEELFARNNYHDLAEFLNSRRDAMDGLFEKYAQSPREVSRRATVEDLVRLLGTRAFDELD